MGNYGEARIIVVLTVLCALAGTAVAKSEHHWTQIPGYKGVFVDLGSIQRFQQQHVGGWSNELPTADTTVDIKIGGRVELGRPFWCKQRPVTVGDTYMSQTDLKTGKTVTSKVPKPAVPEEVFYPSVCGSQP
jgi:hypothetical protein